VLMISGNTADLVCIRMWVTVGVEARIKAV
jgi:hypothetical protein